jgi:hypothetical protein
MAVLLLFKQLLTTSFGFWRVLLPQKNSQWDFTKKSGFHRTRFFLNIIEATGPTMPRAEFFCVLLRSLQSVTREPAGRWSACPPVVWACVSYALPICMVMWVGRLTIFLLKKIKKYQPSGTFALTDHTCTSLVGLIAGCPCSSLWPSRLWLSCQDPMVRFSSCRHKLYARHIVSEAYRRTHHWMMMP